jgi:peptidoglycan-associated lipoprotein
VPGEGDGALSESSLNAERDRRFGEGSIPLAEGEGPFRDVRFGFDSAEVDSIGRSAIDFNANLLQKNPGVRVILEGHADERGTAEYNMALGQRRARAVQELLVSLGVSSSRVSTISYGEEVPLDPNHDEEAWAKNRRVHISGFGKDAG